MNFCLRCESLENRENPSGPSLLDPVVVVTAPPPPAGAVTSIPVNPVIDPNLIIKVNPWGS